MSNPTNKQADFTPGPWEAQNDGNYNLVVINDGQDVLADCGLYNTHIEKRTQREANARLIAAAPDLYAACKQLGAYVEALESLLACYRMGRTPSDKVLDRAARGQQAATDAAFLAIAKAERGVA